VAGSGSGSYPMTGFGISGVETSGSATGEICFIHVWSVIPREMHGRKVFENSTLRLNGIDLET
jgi:hypothetical protein